MTNFVPKDVFFHFLCVRTCVYQFFFVPLRSKTGRCRSVQNDRHDRRHFFRCSGGGVSRISRESPPNHLRITRESPANHPRLDAKKMRITCRKHADYMRIIYGPLRYSGNSGYSGETGDSGAPGWLDIPERQEIAGR